MFIVWYGCRSSVRYFVPSLVISVFLYVCIYLVVSLYVFSYCLLCLFRYVVRPFVILFFF